MHITGRCKERVKDGEVGADGESRGVVQSRRSGWVAQAGSGGVAEATGEMDEVGRVSRASVIWKSGILTVQAGPVRTHTHRHTHTHTMSTHAHTHMLTHTQTRTHTPSHSQSISCRGHKLG